MWWCAVDSTGTREGSVTDITEHRGKHSVSAKTGNILSIWVTINCSDVLYHGIRQGEEKTLSACGLVPLLWPPREYIYLIWAHLLTAILMHGTDTWNRKCSGCVNTTRKATKELGSGGSGSQWWANTSEPATRNGTILSLSSHRYIEISLSAAADQIQKRSSIIMWYRTGEVSNRQDVKCSKPMTWRK
jgi:hypothetical protein